MAENTKIEWADHTFNAWIGCTRVSAGCDNCYAETWDARGLQGLPTRWGPHADRTRTSAANWRKPIAWNRKAAAEGRRYRVFCASLSDVFDNHRSILPEWRADLWALIASTPHLDWLLLTKRPQNIARYLPNDSKAPWYRPWNQLWPWPNVWIGTTVENQEEADRRVPVLLSIPAKVRFLSCEPMLGRVDLTLDGLSCGPCPYCADGSQDPETGLVDCPRCDGTGKGDEVLLDWVICGGESGPGARPMHPDWARSMRDQCVAAGVPFLFKQWGEWAPALHDPEYGGHVLRQTELVGSFDSWKANAYDPDRLEGVNWRRLGKKAAGRMLDGRTWDEVPA